MTNLKQISRLAFGIFVGAVVLGVFGHPLLATQQLNSPYLSVESSSDTVHPSSGRGTGVRDRMLRIEHYAFGRNDSLVCSKAIENMEVRLNPDSAPLRVEVKTKRKTHQIVLQPNEWQEVNTNERHRLENQGWHSGMITNQTISSCRMEPENGIGKLDSLTVNGETVPIPQHELPLFAIGGVLGFFVALGRFQWDALLVIAASTSIWIGVHDWILLAENMALTNTSGWVLSRYALGTMLWPWLICLVIKPLDKTKEHPDSLWWTTGFLACLVACWQHPTLWSVLGILIVFTPGVLHQHSPIRKAWLSGDWPAWACLAAFGWTWGLAGALVWRFCRVVVLRRTLLKEAPGLAADTLYVSMLCLVLAAEIGLRSSYLDTAWSPENLAGEATESDSWRNPQAFWSGRCTNNSTSELRMVYLGGSSTGGAYQFGTEPEAFFAAKIHTRMCNKYTTQSWNYGAAERDSHTISRTLDQILETTNANWIILYVGHNDLTADNPLTRAEREKRSSSYLASIGKWARNSRVVAGSDLFFRSFQKQEAKPVIAAPPLGPDGKPMRTQVMQQGYPMAVPIEDARKNLLAIQSIAEAHDAQVVLIPQIIAQQSFNDLSPYWDLEAEIAQMHDNVHLVDVRHQLEAKDEHSILEDNNHFSRHGHQVLANFVSPKLREVIERVSNQ